MPRKAVSKTTRKQSTSSMLPMLGGGVLVALAFLITISLQNTLLTTSSSAAGGTCGTVCSRDSQCGSGLTCKATYGTRKTCTCGQGNCIQSRCVVPQGTAELGEYCDQGVTRDDRLGKQVSSLNVACKEGLQCLAIATMNGNVTVCCDPTNPNYPANCVDPQLRQVAPKP